jgi:hypothetical protein
MIYLTEGESNSAGQVEIPRDILNKAVKRQDDTFYSAAWTRTLISLFSRLKSAHTIGTKQMLLDVAVNAAMACQKDGSLPALRSIFEVDKREHICPSAYTSFPLIDTA